MNTHHMPKLHVYNTLTRSIEPFIPLNSKKVGFYSCGPTVYGYAHIGNFRAFLFADLLKRVLRYFGYAVNHVMNITDVDDKIIRDAHAVHKSREDFVKEYEDAFFEDLLTLRIDSANYYPRATAYIHKMQEIIQHLVDNGIAYIGNDESIYYSVNKFHGYGKLSHIDLTQLKEGASGRVKKDEYTKDEVHDFALWKAYERVDGNTHWDLCVTLDGKTHTIKGRPGWHIECSAMSSDLLGEQFDIHTGGVDLIFPHHENEIAQSEGSSGKKFVKYWMHNEHLLVDNKKMSKSIGNFYTLRDVLAKGYSPLAFRYLMLSAHYRSKPNFTFESLDAAHNSVTRLQEFIHRLMNVNVFDEKLGKSSHHNLAQIARNAFVSALAQDLDTPAALDAVFTLIKNTYMVINDLANAEAKEILAFLKEFNMIFDVLTFEHDVLPTHVAQLIHAREHARAMKDWTTSDKLRDEIIEQGYMIDDTPMGTRWKKILN